MMLGLSAIFLVASLLLSERNFLTASTRFIASGIKRNSFGGHSPSQRQYRL